MSYGQWVRGSIRRLRPTLRYAYMCTRDMRNCNVDPTGWEEIAPDRVAWFQAAKQNVRRTEEQLTELAVKRRAHSKLTQTSVCWLGEAIGAICAATFASLELDISATERSVTNPQK